MESNTSWMALTMQRNGELFSAIIAVCSQCVHVLYCVHSKTYEKQPHQ